MSLTVNQIDQIKAFINKRGFNTIEVEMEALDHMASKIESLLEEKPDMNFDLAITKAHADLGVFGFATFEEAIFAGCKERSKKIRKAVLRDYLQGPKLLIILAIISVAFLIQKLLLNLPWPEEAMVVFIFSVVLTMVILPSIYFIKTKRKWGKRSFVISNTFAGTSGASLIIFYITRFVLEFGTLSPLLLQITFTFVILILSLIALINFAIIKEAIAFTEEKYLKYA